MRPTEMAHMDFASAGISGMDAYKMSSTKAGAAAVSYEVRMAQTVTSMAYGLDKLTTGLRATYILLEEINRKLDKLTH